jgi:multidrug resistance efflux pump
MKRVLPVLLLVVIFGGGAFIEYHRYQQRSVLSGFFENQPTQVSSRVQGRVARIRVAEGDTVKRGQVLLELEVQPTQRETRSSLASAEEARQRALEVERGPRLEDIRKQEAVVAELAAEVEKLRHGSRPQEIEEARAAERNAHAKLAQAERGLTKEERAQLAARLREARVEEQVTRRDEQRYAALLQHDEVTHQEYDRKRADADRATAARHDAEQAYRRAQEGTPPEELEQARSAWQQARAALDLALAGSRPEDIAAGEARLEQARAQLDELRAGNRREDVASARAAAKAAQATAQRAEINLAEGTVRAPMDGIVERIPVSPGDLVNAGTPLVRMSDPSDIWIRVYVPENDLVAVKVGDTADLLVDGLSSTLPAHVESVATHGEFTPANLQSPEERGRQVFAVRLRLDRSDARVKAGAYATVKRIGAWHP